MLMHSSRFPFHTHLKKTLEPPTSFRLFLETFVAFRSRLQMKNLQVVLKNLGQLSKESHEIVKSFLFQI